MSGLWDLQSIIRQVPWRLDHGIWCYVRGRLEWILMGWRWACILWGLRNAAHTTLKLETNLHVVNVSVVPRV